MDQTRFTVCVNFPPLTNVWQYHRPIVLPQRVWRDALLAAAIRNRVALREAGEDPMNTEASFDESTYADQMHIAELELSRLDSQVA